MILNIRITTVCSFYYFVAVDKNHGRVFCLHIGETRFAYHHDINLLSKQYVILSNNKNQWSHFVVSDARLIIKCKHMFIFMVIFRKSLVEYIQ